MTEQYFPELSRYPKTGGVSEDAIEAFKRQKGYIDLDDPNQRRKFVSGDKPRFNPQLENDRQEGIKKAKREHKVALQNLRAKSVSVSSEKTPSPILEAAYREFKRIAKDAGVTIDQVLAANNKQ